MLSSWEKIEAIIGFEVEQRRQEGCVIAPSLVMAIDAAKSTGDTNALWDLMQQLSELQPEPSFPYHEPNDLDEIRASRPDGPRHSSIRSDVDLFDHIHGAWLGRAAGCALGKPVEKWPKQTIENYLHYYDALPLDDYFPSGKGFPEGHPIEFVLESSDCTRGHISFMARDDDMDFTVLGLAALEQYGHDCSAEEIGHNLISRLPYNLVYTAERIAYRNLVLGIVPPDSALRDNPFREYIGAQIRADIWGYVTPGQPERAAELAYRDACISHVKNGLYSEMFFAALLAATYLTDEMHEAVSIGLSEIPENCRLAEALRNTLIWSQKYSDWQQTWLKIDELYGHYSSVHSINNAALVVMGLIYGSQDFEKTIVTTVLGGLDADCTGATAGSVMGMKLGAKALPDKWVSVFNDCLNSAVLDHQQCSFADLARRTSQLARKD